MIPDEPGLLTPYDRFRAWLGERLYVRIGRDDYMMLPWSIGVSWGKVFNPSIGESFYRHSVRFGIKDKRMWMPRNPFIWGGF